MSRHPNFAFGKPQLHDLPITVSDHVSYVIFGMKRVDQQKSSRFVMISDDETRLPRATTAIDKGYEIAERLKKSYELFVDDRALPNRDEFRHIKTCVVARTCEAAKAIVTTMAMPKTIYLDYHLRRETVMEFVEWLAKWVKYHEIKLDPAFTYHVHGFKTKDEELEVRQILDGIIRDHR